jgi:hypothetical protein
VAERQGLPEGSLLAIPIDAEQFAIGQILVPGKVFYLGIDPERRSPNDNDKSLNMRLFAWTTDGEIYRKTWRLIGARPAPQTFPKPNYKFEQDGELLVETFAGDVVRPFDPQSDQEIRHRWSVTSGILSDAVLAINGLAPWQASFDKLLA